MPACLLAFFLAALGHAAASRFAGFGDAEVQYQTQGEGAEALVFVHGWACDSTFWRRQLEAFPGIRVIALDLPGHGVSDRPPEGYTIDHFARAVEAVMRDAGVERAVLVGHSMGAPVVGRFYGRYPDKTLGLVLVDGMMRPFLPKDQMERILGDLRDDYRASAPAMIDSWLAAVKNPKRRAEIRAAMLATPDHVAIGAFAGMADERAYERGPITVPTLAVLAKSRGWTDGDRDSFRALAPNIEIQEWEKVSHFLMMEKPKKFNKALKGFLKRNGLLTR